MMAICHTAVPERTDGKITYQAASPGTSHHREHSYCRISVIQFVIIYSLVYDVCVYRLGIVLQPRLCRGLKNIIHKGHNIIYKGHHQNGFKQTQTYTFKFSMQRILQMCA